MARVLVVEDERNLAEILAFNLSREGHEVDLAFDGEEALEKIRRHPPDLVVLDVMLPRLDGFTLCGQLRRRSGVPVLMLTARAEEEDKVKGFDAGADDYLTKPFGMREFLSRVKALLRRSRPSPEEGSPSSLVFGDLEIDLLAREVRKKGKRVDLTVREYELLKFLALRPGQPFTREALLEEVWGYKFYGDLRMVDVTVRRLREKIEDHPSQPAFLLTRRGVGYLFQAP
jgi:two-component system response regulator VicR